MNMDFDVCYKCGSVNFVSNGGLEFYLSSCLFCGEFRSNETIVDRDYDATVSSREIPVCKGNYEKINNSRIGQGVAYFAGESVKSRHLKEADYADFHITSWETYDKGVILVKEDESEIWYEEMIEEIKTNSSIDKNKSYVTRWDDDIKELALLYGDELRFLRGSNPLVKSTLDEGVRVITRMIEEEYKYKSDKTIEKIEEKIDKIKAILDSQVTEELVDIYNIIGASEDDEAKFEKARTIPCPRCTNGCYDCLPF